MEAFTFQCSICGDSSTKLCVYCTKDACGNHLCERCHRCSDCCLCELPTSAPDVAAHSDRSHGLSPEVDTGIENSESPDSTVLDGVFSH